MWLFVILSAIFWRFFNYGGRWTLSQDQARDAIIGLYSLSERTLPLVGPPSSTGQFSFGPIYYWIISLFTLIFPFIWGPWVGFTILSLTSVILFYLIGKILGGKLFSIILGFLAAFASASIFHSVDMLNPILVLFFTTLAIFSLVKLVDQKKIGYSFTLGLSVGLSVGAHLEAIGLLSLLILSLLINNFTSRGKWLTFVGECVGLLTAFLPTMYFNIQNNFIQVKNIFLYLVSGHTQMGVSSSWIKDLGYFWPRLWGEVLTFIPNLGYFFLAIVAITVILSIQKNIKIPKSWWIISLSLVIQAVLLRYYGGIRLPLYLLVFHPFIIFLTAHSIWITWNYKRILGISILTIFLLSSSFSNLKIVEGNTQKPYIESIKKIIDEKISGNIAIYDKHDPRTTSLPLLYLYIREGRIEDDGHKIGICQNKFLEEAQIVCPTEVTPFRRVDADLLYDLSGLSEQRILEIGFKKITSKKIYESLY